MRLPHMWLAASTLSILLLRIRFSRAWVLPPPGLGQYLLQDEYIGYDFLDRWKWETSNDPTHGRVNYVNRETAIAANLSFVSDDKFVMRADAIHTVSPDARGRDSVRISSFESYEDALFVLDLSHMPEGCATWPAFWTLSKAGPWPRGGEIDIIEGVNTNVDNLSSLHTTPNCTLDELRYQSGRTVTTNCDASVNYNQGCGTTFRRPNSYGCNFNANRGGWYVMQRSRDVGISIWFWSRCDPLVPWDIKEGLPEVNPSPAWGPPDTYFGFNSCDYDTHFDAHIMIFDLTFCGDWAGHAFPDSDCGSDTCESFVDNNPSAFVNAYWEINALRVYT
ncbi:hypothetical protein AX17_006168 [Amanita inopinata Kibby_2008]|nr:hypothetical protein AX17_006168 [Amanita inopinata Kibby_2008]